MPGVADLKNVHPLKYYRFVRDFHYANFEIIFQKVHFALLFLSKPQRYVPVLLHRWWEIGQYRDLNLPFWGMGYSIKSYLRKKLVNFQHAIGFNEWKFRFLY